jgi:hypothetical protein
MCAVNRSGVMESIALPGAAAGAFGVRQVALATGSPARETADRFHANIASI